MSIARRPAFVAGAKALLLLKLAGEPSFGFEARALDGTTGRGTFAVDHVDRLSPADRAGMTRGDELYSIQVLGVDQNPFPWCSNAVDRVEQIWEIWVVKIWVIKRGGRRITEIQQRRYDHIQNMLTRAKAIRIQGLRARGEFIQSQLEKVVVLIYDYEHAHFGAFWKVLSEADRSAIAIPVARSFVSDTRLRGLIGEAPLCVTTPTASVLSTPAQTPRSVSQVADQDVTESEVSTPPRARTPDETGTEGGGESPPRHIFIPLPKSYAPDRPSIDEDEQPLPVAASKKKRRVLKIKAEMVDAP